MNLLRIYIAQMISEAIDQPINNWASYIKNRLREFGKTIQGLDSLQKRLSSWDEDKIEEISSAVRYLTKGNLTIDDIESVLRLFSKSNSNNEYRYLGELLESIVGYIGDSYSVTLLGYLTKHLERVVGEYGTIKRLKRVLDELGGFSNWSNEFSQNYGLDNEYVQDASSFMNEVKNVFSFTVSFVEKMKEKIEQNNRWRDHARSGERAKLPPSEDIEMLYHASPEANKLMSQGFVSSGAIRSGLGGGSEGGVSFTHDYNTARTIMRTLRDVAAIAQGELRANEILQWWKDDIPEEFEKLVKTDPEFRKFDPKDKFKVFELFNRYLWLNSTRDNPVLFQTNREWFERFSSIDPSDIGIIVAKVNVKYPDIEYLPAEREFRVPPEAIISVEKRVA